MPSNDLSQKWLRHFWDKSENELRRFALQLVLWFLIFPCIAFMRLSVALANVLESGKG